MLKGEQYLCKKEKQFCAKKRQLFVQKKRKNICAKRRKWISNDVASWSEVDRRAREKFSQVEWMKIITLSSSWNIKMIKWWKLQMVMNHHWWYSFKGDLERCGESPRAQLQTGWLKCSQILQLTWESGLGNLTSWNAASLSVTKKYGFPDGRFWISKLGIPGLNAPVHCSEGRSQ